MIHFCHMITEVMNRVEKFGEESLFNQINTVFLPLEIFFVLFWIFIMKLLLSVFNALKEMKIVCHHALGA